MKKQTKAAIAVGAGAILLLGGAGSLAYWNDTTTIPGGKIDSGQLSLAPCAGGGAWTDTNKANAPIDINLFKIVPGDTVAFACNSTINATGNNLKATLTADVLPTVGGNNELAAALNTTVTATVGGTTLPAGSPGVQITPAAGAQSANLKVSITFNAATSGTVAQNQSVNLSAMTLNLVQNPNP